MNAVPSVAEKADSTERNRSLLLVKSVRTCRLELIAATATRSAPVICPSTHFTASSIANDEVDGDQTYPTAEAGRLRRLLCDEQSPGRDTQLHDREQDPVRVIDPPNPP